MDLWRAPVVNRMYQSSHVSDIKNQLPSLSSHLSFHSSFIIMSASIVLIRYAATELRTERVHRLGRRRRRPCRRLTSPGTVVVFGPSEEEG